MPLTVGDRLGHYDVTALIGEGGNGHYVSMVWWKAVSNTATMGTVEPSTALAP